MIVRGVRTALGFEFRSSQVILTAGTFLNGLMHFGSVKVEGGRISEDAAKGITEQLVRIGFRADRMKTGTPARLDGRTIDFSKAEVQWGDDNPDEKFSFLPGVRRTLKNRPCWIVHTNPCRPCGDGFPALMNLRFTTDRFKASVRGTVRVSRQSL